MRSVFLIDKFRHSWSESQLRWLDLLGTCVMFYWVDLPMLGFPFEENPFETEYALYFPLIFHEATILTGVLPSWKSYSFKTWENSKSNLGGGEDRHISEEKKKDPLFCTYFCWSRGGEELSALFLVSGWEWSFSGLWAGLDGGKQGEWYLWALGIWLKSPGKVPNQVASIPEEASFKNCTGIIQC